MKPALESWRRELIEQWRATYLEQREAQELEDKNTELSDELATLQDALWEIRDWFDSVLVRKEPMRDPRKVLALVERELGL